MKSDAQVPDKRLLQRWLREADIEFNECDQCAGLHLPALQAIEGVAESRLFVEEYGLLLTTELEIRQVAVLVLVADLGRLNMDYPVLKVFQDVVDDSVPLLVAAAVLQTQAGVTSAQFAQFVATTAEATRQLASECRHLDYLYLADDADRASPAGAPYVH